MSDLSLFSSDLERAEAESQAFVLEGSLSIEAALKYDSRKIYRCYIDLEKIKKRDRKALYLRNLLKEKNVEIELCDRAVIDAFAESHSCGSTHGGILAVCGERKTLPFESLLDTIANEGGYAVVLDGVEDPYNFGYAVRDLYAVGVGGMLLPKRNPLKSAGICARSSAGATEMCRMAFLPDIDTEEKQTELMRLLKKKGFYTVCAAKTGNCESLFSFEPSFPAVLFIGGEKRGISPALVENCDTVVAVPYYSDARYSLSAASTATVFGFYMASYRERERERES